MADPNVTTAGTASAVEINKVLRNTYLLLGMTLAFSALMAYVALAINAPYLGLWTLVVWIGLLFGIHKTANSVWGLVMVFAFTGFLGFSVGPVVGFYLAMPNGLEVVTMALGSTAAAFVGLSLFAVITRKDFSFMTSFLMVGIVIVFAVVILSWFLDLSAFYGAIGGAVVLLMSGLILWQTSEIIHGGETNYILATTTLYMSIYNMFQWLLLLFGMGED
ncbi:MAG: Bax inhibitor-1/YccA family protein [Pseudomonadales bacterium]|jgi:modulator of FtsH protease|nr:Bax inhibitor-1/YccA family protein [Pseudomonadales bacterium]MDP6470046.1 Bax inhibitor-1/YccA family protein [Pseudomonadales bacterium]MDP6826949.1 Bax inhibitor-1/YccA family protein [Pseudomonadales bacterium]MDP6971044.1 Bax inhibitor-1/YccA family protein [Pseudomonadales bacterium]|tara:strand:+ start:315 stop:971 length:657 start_codon:yes stop_codon:yes gene_type:complete